MRVILKEKISGQGNPGQIINVKRGYARNFLLPQNKAVPVNAENLAWLESEKAVFDALEKTAIADANKASESFKNVALVFQSTLKDGESLYGSIGVSEVLTALKEKGLSVDRNMLSLPEGNIRKLGDYKVRIQLHDTVVVTCPIKVELASVDED